MENNNIKIVGWQKTSTIDYPGKLATVFFTKNCNFICPYCYNLNLLNSITNYLTEKEIFNFLEKRKNILEAVVISGGEPSLELNLINFIKKVKGLGYLIKLDTNGSRPQALKMLLPLIDYLALDIKTDFENYPLSICKEKDFKENFIRTIELLNKYNVIFEIRTTCVQPFINEKIIEKIAQTNFGEKAWFLQKFKNENLYNQDFFNMFEFFSDEQLNNFLKIALKYKKHSYLR